MIDNKVDIVPYSLTDNKADIVPMEEQQGPLWHCWLSCFVKTLILLNLSGQQNENILFPKHKFSWNKISKFRKNGEIGHFSDPAADAPMELSVHNTSLRNSSSKADVTQASICQTIYIEICLD